MFVIATVSSQFIPSVGQFTQFFDPGPAGENITKEFCEQLKENIDYHIPALIYSSISFTTDDQTTHGYKLLADTLEDQMSAGKTCVIADTRVNERWELFKQPVLVGEGDLAFICNDEGVLDELREYTHERIYGIHAVLII